MTRSSTRIVLSETFHLLSQSLWQQEKSCCLDSWTSEPLRAKVTAATFEREDGQMFGHGVVGIHRESGLLQMLRRSFTWDVSVCVDAASNLGHRQPRSTHLVGRSFSCC